MHCDGRLQTVHIRAVPLTAFRRRICMQCRRRWLGPLGLCCTRQQRPGAAKNYSLNYSSNYSAKNYSLQLPAMVPVERGRDSLPLASLRHSLPLPPSLPLSLSLTHSLSLSHLLELSFFLHLALALAYIFSFFFFLHNTDMDSSYGTSRWELSG